MVKKGLSILVKGERKWQNIGCMIIFQMKEAGSGGIYAGEFI